MGAFMQRKIRMTPVRLLVLGYLVIILVGAILLVLPFSSKMDGGAPFIRQRILHARRYLVERAA